MDFVNRLTDIVLDEDTWLTSLDVALCVYSNIGHYLGLQAFKFSLDAKGVVFQTHTGFILELFGFILEHIFFLFDGKMYKQRRGTAMGTTCALTYANLFLGWWECNYSRRV